MKRVGKIHHQLTLFVVAISVVLLLLVWFLNIRMLEPIYNRMIWKELQLTANTYKTLIQKYETLEDENGPMGVNEAFYAESQKEEYTKLLEGKCIEISNANLICLLKSHNLASNTCLLHPAQVGYWGETREPAWNNNNVVSLRLQALRQGDSHFTIENENGLQQMVVLCNVENKYTVIVSTDVSRIDEASNVLMHQMPLIAILVLCISIFGAGLFSRWFTRPILRISDAAHEMAKGNYNVRIDLTTQNEIGMLAQDFNSMAYEVGRTADLQKDLIANISHDLRTPLTLMKGYAETVRDITGDDAQKRTRQMDVIIEETDRLSTLVNSVMELSKYAAGAFLQPPVLFDLAQLCEETAQRYKDICEKNGYTLHLQTQTSCMVFADPGSMQRVIHNLLGNAVHHIGQDGWISLTVKQQTDGSTCVEVADHGTGISKEDLPHIFDKYYRARANAGKEGTGLGLSIVKAILINHGYKFGVDSEEGKGSVFWFVATPPEQ